MIDFKLSNYALETSSLDVSDNGFWCGYIFSPSKSIQIFSIIGGGVSEYTGALFKSNNGTPVELLINEQFSPNTDDALVELTSPIVLHPEFEYFIAQSVSDENLINNGHYLVGEFDSTLILNENFFSLWYPINQSIYFPIAGNPENILNQNSYEYSDNLPRIGFQYQVTPGDLIVYINPEEISNIAEWKFVDEDEWQNSNTTFELSEGLYTLQFSSIQGMKTPNDINVIIESGETREISVYYPFEFEIDFNNKDTHTLINNIVFYYCYIRDINLYDIATHNELSNVNDILNKTIQYICDISVEFDYINFPHDKSLHSIFNYFFQYVCQIPFNSCFTTSTFLNLDTVINEISDYLCNINLEYNCVFKYSDQNELQYVLNEIFFYLCNIELKENCLDIPKPSDLHSVIKGFVEYVCKIQLKYSCIDVYNNIYWLTVSKTGEGNVQSNPAGISCPTNCQTQYVLGTNVGLEAFSEDNWKFERWEGPYVDFTNTSDTIIIDSMKNIFNMIIHYLCNIYIFPTCLDLQGANPLHIVINKILEYICFININMRCVETRDNTLWDILNAITKYLCTIKFNVSCFNTDDTIAVDYFECKSTMSSDGSAHAAIYTIIEYLCYIPLSNNCVESPEPVSMQKILQYMLDYICKIEINNCFTGNPIPLHEFLQDLDSYICNINISHCLDNDDINFTPDDEFNEPPVPVDIPTPPPPAPPTPGWVNSNDHVLCYIDEAEACYWDSGPPGDFWEDHVQELNSLIDEYNVDTFKMIGFRVYRSDNYNIIPTDGGSPSPVSTFDVGKNESAETMYNDVQNNIGIEAGKRFVIFVDISGSMDRSDIEPGIDGLIQLLQDDGHDVVEYNCGGEKWLAWISNAIKGADSVCS